MAGRPPTRGRRLVGRAALAIGLGWLTALLVNRSLRRVDGESMLPTLAPGDLLLTIPGRAGVRVGSIVVASDPREPARRTVKRVAATGGQPAYICGEVSTTPRGHLALEGDNARASTDSGDYGAVPVPLVAARVVARIWPAPTIRLSRDR